MRNLGYSVACAKAFLLQTRQLLKGAYGIRGHDHKTGKHSSWSVCLSTPTLRAREMQIYDLFLYRAGETPYSGP